MGQNICLKLWLLEKVLVLDEVADVPVRSLHPGRDLQLKPRCIWFSPEAEKLDGAGFFSCPFTEVCDLCKSFGWANREVSALNQLYSKSTVCLCFSTLLPKARSILLQVECIHRANILKVSRRVLYFPLQEPFSWFRKRCRTHSCFRTVNSLKKNCSKKHSFFFFWEYVMQSVFMG